MSKNNWASKRKNNQEFGISPKNIKVSEQIFEKQIRKGINYPASILKLFKIGGKSRDTSF